MSTLTDLVRAYGDACAEECAAAEMYGTEEINAAKAKQVTLLAQIEAMRKANLALLTGELTRARAQVTRWEAAMKVALRPTRAEAEALDRLLDAFLATEDTWEIRHAIGRLRGKLQRTGLLDQPPPILIEDEAATLMKPGTGLELPPELARLAETMAAEVAG